MKNTSQYTEHYTSGEAATGGQEVRKYEQGVTDKENEEWED